MTRGFEVAVPGLNHNKLEITVEDSVFFWVAPHDVDEWRGLIKAKQVRPLGYHSNLANGFELVGLGRDGKETARLQAAGLEPFDGSLRHELNASKRPQCCHDVRLDADLIIDELVVIVILVQSVVIVPDVIVDCKSQAFSALATKDLVLSLQIVLLRLPGLVHMVVRKTFGFFLEKEDLLGRGDFGV